MQANLNYQKNQIIQQKLRRGRFRHERYYRMESERLAAEQEEHEAVYRDQINFEATLSSYPSKFKVAHCLTNERTFPSCKSSIKAPTQLESFTDIEKARINPRASA